MYIDTILIVDDNRSSRAMLKNSLRTQGGYATVEAASGREALERVLVLEPDAILIDFLVSDVNGFELLVQLRKRTDAPLLVVSCIRDVRVKIKALEAGADDYLAKPFGVDELLARLRARLRRSRPTASWIGLQPHTRFEVDLEHFAATLGTEILTGLTRKELEILGFLLERAGMVVSYQDILRSVWGIRVTRQADQHRLRVNISNLRRKLASLGSGQTSISNVSGWGYRLESVTNPGPVLMK